MTPPSDLKPDILHVLRGAKTGKGTHPTWMTAYQILEGFGLHMRDSLIQERGTPGLGAGTYGAASLVAAACMQLAAEGMVEISYLDTTNLRFVIDHVPHIPGYEVCGIYRAA